jgi:hypothetical protein
MPKFVRIGVLAAALGACLGLLLWVGASGPPPLRPSVVQPQDHAQPADKDKQGHDKGESGKSLWERTTADPIALFTFGIFVFTAALAFSTIGLWIATARTATLSRDEFNATHRPQIIVHSFEHATIADRPRRIGVELKYVNAGATQATIVEIGSTIIPTSGSPRPGISLSIHPLKDKRLSAGEWAIWAIDSDIAENAAIVENMRQERGFQAAQIMCIGYIRYEDTNGRPRQTGFCRQYDANSRSWLRVENSDYEYAY